MPVDLLWTTAGFLVGVGATALALEFAFRKVRNDERASLNKDWNLERLATDGPPGIVAASLEGVKVPAGSRVLVSPGSRIPKSVMRTCKLRIHHEAEGNFAVGSGKAVLCTGPMVPGTLALTTLHPALVSKLERAFESLWVQGKAYSHRVALQEIAANEGSFVEVQGTVDDVLSSGDKAMVRLRTSRGTGSGMVLVPAKLPLEKGKAYQFTGHVVTEGNHKAVKAETVKELDKQAAAPATA